MRSTTFHIWWRSPQFSWQRIVVLTILTLAIPFGLLIASAIFRESYISQLRRGMSPEEVAVILGPPVRTIGPAEDAVRFYKWPAGIVLQFRNGQMVGEAQKARRKFPDKEQETQRVDAAQKSSEP